ncbi:MAG: HD domain-containing protein [Candidatus Thorarchaeota archaeon]
MDPDKFMDIAMQGEVLKNLPRMGWILAGFDRSLVETVAAHSFGTALISLLLAKQLICSGSEIDIGRTLTMAVIHDLAEARTSDIVVYKGDSADTAVLNSKRETENRVMADILKPLGLIGKDLEEVWTSLRDKSSIESRLVAAADILDMLIHAISMEQSGAAPTLLAGFFDSSRNRLSALDMQIALDLYDELLRMHNAELSR